MPSSDCIVTYKKLQSWPHEDELTVLFGCLHVDYHTVSSVHHECKYRVASRASPSSKEGLARDTNFRNKNLDMLFIFVAHLQYFVIDTQHFVETGFSTSRWERWVERNKGVWPSLWRGLPDLVYDTKLRKGGVQKVPPVLATHCRREAIHKQCTTLGFTETDYFGLQLQVHHEPLLSRTQPSTS